MKSSIQRKIFIFMFIVAIIPVTMLTFFATRNQYNSLNSQIISSGENSIDYMHDKTESMLKEYSEKFYELEVDEEFKSDINTWCYDEDGFDYNTRWRIITVLNYWMNTNREINSINVNNLVNGQLLSVKRTGAHFIDNGNGFEIWTDRDETLQTNTVFIRDKEEMVVLHQMNRFETGKPLVVIEIRLQYSAFESFLDEMKTDNREAVFLFNDEDELIAFVSDNPETNLIEMIPDYFEEIKARPNESGVMQKKDLYIFGRSVSKDKLYVIRAIPEEIVTAATAETLRTGVIFGILGIVVAFVMSFFLSKLISKPIVDLTDTMDGLLVDEYAHNGYVERKDEIGQLENSLYYMIERNQELINKEYKSKLEKQKAQINALQAQINPHFLYNTLQVIGGMTLKKQTGEIYNMTLALSDMMRYSLNFATEMVKLEDEIKYLESYILIQNQRFENRILMNVLIDDDIKKVMIPKLSLQPIVENSFKHGFENILGDWCIDIIAYKKQDDATVIVSDNGVGISQSRLSELNAILENSDTIWDSEEHIGIKNVNKRIKLIYGEDYGLKIQSEEDNGTRVEIMIKAELEDVNEV